YTIACDIEGIGLTDTDENVNTCFFSAIINENNNTVQLLLTLKVLDINYQNNDQKTALHLAIEHKNIDALDYLFTRANINVNLKDKNGYTPLELAEYLVSEYPDDIDYANILDKLNDLIRS
ncbi:MAG: ankyrin repeat domain-containing protein, partial [Bacilli bacterium]|nr:ankyrin repeat domain-containing protein [Bacilli bacterium]